jgi:hypothetical protein
MPLIKATVGRIVWYGGDKYFQVVEGEPLAAIIAKVNDDSTVNLTVFDGDGSVHGRQNIPLLQGSDKLTPDEPFCTWMPYQVGQAAKNEELERQLKTSAAGESIGGVQSQASSTNEAEESAGEEGSGS